MKTPFQHIKHTTTISVLIFLAACGSNDQTASSSTPHTQATEASELDNVLMDELKLSNTALNQDEFLGLVVPEIKAAEPCPYLSDATAKATAKTNWTLERRETSVERCYWSKNAGFSVKVTVEPLATAQPVQERAYNIDNPPVLKPQAGPGNNAVVLYDTTWDKELAYAMAFEQADKLIMIKVTGMNTDAQRLTRTANEVASRLTDGLSAQAQSIDSGDVLGFDMCNTWSQSEISTIIGQPLKMTSGSLDCGWETGSGDNMKQIRITIYSGKSYPWDAVLEYRGSKKIEGIGERGLIEKKRKRANMPGHILLNTLYKEKLVTVTVTDNIENYEAIAMALSKNINERLK